MLGEVLTAIATGRVQRGRGRPRGMPAAVEQALRKGLAERPEQRHASMAELLAQLERATALPERRRRRLVRVGVGLTILALIVALLWSIVVGFSG